jgi:cytochrome c peroxidase
MAKREWVRLLPALSLIAGCGSTVGSGDVGRELATEQEGDDGELDVDVTKDALGKSATASADDIDLSADNPFFKSFGTNGRVCGTCHQESQGWTITPDFARSRSASDPLFAFDGSDCLPPGVANTNPTLNSTQMRSKANVRIDLPIPSGADFTLTSYSDPLGCPTAPSAAGLRMYRRPLPTSNTAFATTVMWDGRENVNPPNATTALMHANLAHQANDATLGHAQAAQPLSASTADAMVVFETGLFNAQQKIGSLDLGSAGAHGGPAFLYTDTRQSFFIGINDVFSPSFTSVIFTVFSAWETNPKSAQAAAIGRGEVLFNTKTFSIDDVRGINSSDPADGDPIGGTFTGSCGTCHDTPNIGHHSVSLPIDIGVTAGSPVGGLDVANLPVYTFTQAVTGKTITVTDPGRALISGRFKDIGKTKGPNLRALAARAPYFHNGSAKDLAAVVHFYDQRFNIGFTTQEAADLVAFLQAL